MASLASPGTPWNASALAKASTKRGAGGPSFGSSSAAVTRAPPVSSSCVETMTALAPRCSRTRPIASIVVRPVNVLSCMRFRPLSNRAQGLDACLGMDLVLRHDDGHGAEALDDRTDIGPDRRARQQHGVLAAHGEALEIASNGLNEFLELQRRHAEMALLALSREGFGEGLLPLRRECDERNDALVVGIGVGNLPREAGAHVLGDDRDVAARAASLE